MTTWLESTNVHQDGTPVTRKIKIPEMGEEIWWTDNAYAEVSDDVGDILANNIDSISKLASAPSSPGTYYGDANSNTTVQINISDGVFDAVTLESLDADSISTGEIVIGPDPSDGFSGIQAAVDKIDQAGGGVLDLQENATYEYDSTVRIELPDNILIKGNGATLLGNGDETTDGHVVLTNKDWSTHTSNIVIRDLLVDGGFASHSQDAKEPQYGGTIHWVNCDNVHLDNVDGTRSWRHILEFVDCQDCSVRNSEYYDPRGDDAISVSDGSHELGGTEGASSSKNIHFYNCRVYGIPSPEAGVEVDDGPHYIFFHGCAHLDDSGVGFTTKVHGNEVPPHNIYFNNCYSGGNVWIASDPKDDPSTPIQDVHWHGGVVGAQIQLWGVDSCSVSDATVSNDSGAAISVSDNTTFQPTDIRIANCDLKADGSSAGIKVVSVDNLQIDNVSIRNASHGIALTPGTGQTVQRVQISGCDAEATTTLLRLQPTDTAVVEDIFAKDNVAFDNTQNAIAFLGDGAGNYSGDIIAEDNVLKYSSWPALDYGTSAIGDAVTTRENTGWVTENSGSASVADAGTISHGLDETPSLDGVRVWTNSSNRAYATAVDSSSITIALEDPSGASVGTAETVNFEAETR